MPIYEFICKTPQGKEVRGECRAKNAEDLASTLAGTGLMLRWWQEKRAADSRTTTKAFAQEVAGMLKSLSEPRHYQSHRTRLEKLQLILIGVGLIGGGVWLYNYLDSRIGRLEQLSYRPHIIKEIYQHTQELPQ